jgi:membrane-bound ClpP family serine protease
LNTADLVFGACLVLGGGLLLLTLIFDDLFGGILNAIHLGFDLGGVSPTPVLLGFLAMFGVGGLFGLHSLGLGQGIATLVGGAAGIAGGGVVLGAFKVLGAAQSTESFSLQDMVGSTGRVSVGIPANRYGTVLISFAGASHSMGATADAEIAAGRVVKVVGVAGNNLVVESVSVTTSTEGARSDA